MIAGIRAPVRHGELACDPPLESLSGLVHQDLVRPKFDTFNKIKNITRREILKQLGPCGGNLQADSVWIGVGHQPEVFHPGVWAKNYLAGGLANLVKAVSLNVVVDTDSPAHLGIKVPSLVLDRWPRKATLIPFAPPNRGTPWQSINLVPGVFGTFQASLLKWADEAPWKSAIKDWFGEMDQAQRSANFPLWEFFQAARHGLEKSWGLNQPGLSLSTLTMNQGFQLFCDLFLSDFTNCHTAYNEALSQFRRLNGIRDTGRPVPNLEKVGDWVELPFWAFLPSDHQRARLWCRQTGASLELGASRDGSLIPEPLGQANPKPGDLVNHFDFPGITIWPRALTTTLFLRGFVFDWFVHGIGGALYDQVTELWAKLWLKTELGARVASSLTMRLPLPKARATQELAQKAGHNQRHFYWNPDLLLKGQLGGLSPEESSELEALRSSHPNQGKESKNRFLRLRRLGDTLRRRAGEILEQGWREVDRLYALSSEEKMVSSREFAFPLHPIEELKKKLQPLLELKTATGG